MILHNFKLYTQTLSWGNHTENFLENNLIHISNLNSGLPTSSFFIETGLYEINISDSDFLIQPEGYLYFRGFPLLCGTEVDNLFLEDTEDNFKREYGLSHSSLSCILF